MVKMVRGIHRRGFLMRWYWKVVGIEVVVVVLGVPKKLSFDNFQHYRDYLEWRFFCYENKRQRAISEQILKTFGQCQNCQNLTFK